MSLVLLLQGCVFTPQRVNPKPPIVEGYPQMNMKKIHNEIQKERYKEMKEFSKFLEKLSRKAENYQVQEENNDAIDSLLNSLTN